MKTKYLIPAMLLLMLAGCYKEQTPVEEGSVPRKGTFNFSSSTGEVTKVLLNSDNTLFWAAGDKIAVYDYKAGSVYAKDIAVLTGGEGTAVGTFTPSTLSLNTSWYNAEDADNQQYNFYAYYPGGNSAPDPEAGNVTVSVAASQQESAGIGKYIVSWASANTTKQNLAGDSAPNFAFTPKSALLKLALQNNTSHATNITQIIITATGGNIAGNASLTLASGALSAGASNVITYTPASPIQIAPNSTLSVPVYVSVLPCAATNLAISCNESEGVYGAVNIAMSSIASGKVYSKTAVLTSFESQRFVIANPGDQSAKSDVLEANNLYYGTANCVLVSKANTSFDVNIQLFRTNDGYSRSAASAGPFTSAVTSAKIIWAESGLSTDADFKITGGSLSKITLSKTANTTGNALLGIYDADGRILWSYHIWVPEDDSEVTPEQGLNADGQQYSKALNLALGQIESAHDPYMYYQFGRKDPLGRANAIAPKPGLMATSGDGPSESKFIHAEETGHSGNNLVYARQNPTVFISSADRSQMYDWYVTQQTVLDATLFNNNLWGASATIYDPCPEGYHVPDKNKLWNVAAGQYTLQAVREGVTNVEHATTDKYFTILGLDYVYGGYRHSWNSSVVTVAENFNYWSFSVNGRSCHDLGANINGVVNPVGNGNGRVHGYGVRCVKGGPISSYESKDIENSTDQTAKSAVLEANNLYYGTANSVLVDKTATSISVNIQLFKSANGYARSAASASPFTSAVTSAKIIWTESGLSSDANFKITGGNLATLTLSKTENTTGNALVGIYDADGRILWSYHIWVPEDASEVTPERGTNSYGQQYSKALKYALGQVESSYDTYMYYQWGRKDPLGRANSLATGGTLMSTSGDGPSVNKKISALATGHSGNNLAYARQNPTMYIMHTGDGTHDWYPTQDVNDASHRNDNLWGASATIYDPCPYGYHVPDNNKLWKVSDGNYSVGATVSGVDFTHYDTYKYFNILGLDYVRGGCRGGDLAGVYHVADYGCYWSFGVNERYGRRLDFDSATVYPAESDNRASGFGVRCVK